MLDEPSMGLAPLVVAEVFKVIKRVNEMGITVLLVEQNANMALKISNRAYLMTTGKIVLEDTGENLLKSGALTEAYLGAKKS
jgi:branched-chain amino acid transport system ATP-binding protein